MKCKLLAIILFLVSLLNSQVYTGALNSQNHQGISLGKVSRPKGYNGYSGFMHVIDSYEKETATALDVSITSYDYTPEDLDTIRVNSDTTYVREQMYQIYYKFLENRAFEVSDFSPPIYNSEYGQSLRAYQVSNNIQYYGIGSIRISHRKDSTSFQITDRTIKAETADFEKIVSIRAAKEKYIEVAELMNSDTNESLEDLKVTLVFRLVYNGMEMSYHDERSNGIFWLVKGRNSMLISALDGKIDTDKLKMGTISKFEGKNVTSFMNDDYPQIKKYIKDFEKATAFDGIISYNPASRYWSFLGDFQEVVIPQRKSKEDWLNFYESLLQKVIKQLDVDRNQLRLDQLRRTSYGFSAVYNQVYSQKEYKTPYMIIMNYNEGFSCLEITTNCSQLKINRNSFIDQDQARNIITHKLELLKPYIIEKTRYQRRFKDPNKDHKSSDEYELIKRSIITSSGESKEGIYWRNTNNPTLYLNIYSGDIDFVDFHESYGSY